ncbi:hypothetical protein KC342_g4506 [Hortaea werneckii]|nr:hypothetical protein KC342_g4506 [Hortaea werneckii]
MDRSLDEIISERPRVADHLHPALVPAEVPHRRGLRAGRSIPETAYERCLILPPQFERRSALAFFVQRLATGYTTASTTIDTTARPVGVLGQQTTKIDMTLRAHVTTYAASSSAKARYSVKLVYDRMDRSTGMAYVTYADYRDARDAVEDYDGQNANGLPIKITILPQAPAAATRGPSLFERIERPPRSLFDRLDSSAREDSREGFGRRRRERSDSPRKSRAMAERVDRYVPRSRSPPTRRRGPPREPGRRPGQRREDNGRRGGRRPRTDEEGRPLVGGRPKKTADELDAEMDDYFNSGKGDDGGKANGAAENGSGGAPAPAPAGEEDTDMVL